MAELVIRPNGAGVETNIATQVPGSGAHWDKVDESVADKLTTYISSSDAAYQRDLYAIPLILGAGTISKVTIHAVCQTGSIVDQESLKLCVRTHAIVYESAEIELAPVTWKTFSNSWATNPNTAAAWTWEEIAALQIGLSLRESRAGFGVAAICTQLWAVVSYTPPAAPTFSCRIAFASAPFAASPSWDDVSSDFVAFDIKRGRQHELDRFEAGTATVLLKNIDGHYWSKNTAGDYYPNVKLGKRLNIRATYDGVTYDRYTGFIAGYTPVWFSEEGQMYPGMLISCADLQRVLSLAKLNDGAGYAQEASGTRVGNVLDDVGWPAGARSIDAGVENMQATGALSNVVAMEHLYKVQESELSIFWIRGDGYAMYQERGARTSSPYDTVQAVFGDGNLPVFNPILPLDDLLLFNEIRLQRTGGTEQNYSDATSITDYGLRTLARSGLLLTADITVYLLCLYLLARYHEGQMRVKEITIRPQTPGYEFRLWRAALGFEIGTRIGFIRNEASIDDEYFIEGISESWDYRKGQYETRYQLSDAGQYYYGPDATSETLRPSAAGDLTTLTPSAGANWQCVDEESADEDTTYVQAPADGVRYTDLYNVPSIAPAKANIFSVIVYVRVRKTGASTIYGNIAIKTGGVVFHDSDFEPTNSYANYSKTYLLNPDTGVAWTIADIAALQIGVRLQSDVPAFTNVMRCTQVYAVVNYTPQW